MLHWPLPLVLPLPVSISYQLSNLARMLPCYFVLHAVNSDPHSSTPPPPDPTHPQAPPTNPSLSQQPPTSTTLQPLPSQTAGSAQPVPPPSLVVSTSSGSHVPPPTPSLGVGGQTRDPQEAKVDTIPTSVWESNRMVSSSSGDPGVKGHHGMVNGNAMASPTGIRVHQANGVTSSLTEHRHYRFSIDLRSLQNVTLEPGIKCYLRYALVCTYAHPS